jgi:hypothetical protein
MVICCFVADPDTGGPMGPKGDASWNPSDSTHQDRMGHFVLEEIVVKVVRPWERPLEVPNAPVVTVTPEEARQIYERSPFEQDKVSRSARKEINRVLRNKVFAGEAERVFESSVEENRELGVLRVYERDGVYDVYSVGTPSAERANRILVRPVDPTFGRHVFDAHPHPSGSPRPSPADLGTSHEHGTPGVVNYSKRGFTIYEGVCKEGRQC